MNLRLLRFLETLFAIPAAYFGDKADDIDTELHKRLRAAMADITDRKLTKRDAGD